MYKVRFHLAEGQYKGFWQIKGPEGTIYIDPNESDFIMWKVKLKNHKTTAKKILGGAHKTVCAWIECVDYEICSTISMPNYWGEAKFNPRKCEHWTNADYGDLDNKSYVIAYTYKKQIFVKGMGF